MTRRKKRSRKEIVEKIKRLLQKRGSPRFQMGIIVLSTASAGFLYSFMLLSQGLRFMSIRYVLAIFLAYLTFLFLIWLWLKLQKRRLEVDVDIDVVDIVDIVDDFPAGKSVNTGFTGGDGSFGGGGVSESFGEAKIPQPEIVDSGGGSGGPESEF